MDEHASNEAVLRRLHLNSEGSDSSSNDENPGALTCQNEINPIRPNGCDSVTSNNNKMECEATDLPCSLPLSSLPPIEMKPKDEMVTDMLKRLSHSSAHFKHQQRNEPDLTPQEKYEIARSVYEKSPALFLSRFKKHLTCDDVYCFEEYIGDYEIDFHLKEIQRISSPSYTRNKVKNRRYKALMQMMSLGDEYFTEEAMKARDPLLYEEMIGRYLTKEERSSKAAEIMGNNEFVLSDFLMKHIAQIQENNLYYNLKDKEVTILAILFFYFYFFLIRLHKIPAQLSGFVEYADCISAE